MEENHTTKSPLRFIIPIILVAMMGLGVAHFVVVAPTKPKNVWREEMHCLSAVCLKDSYGIQSCIEIEPQVARIVVSPESSPSNQLRLNTVLEGKPCSTEI